MSLSEEPKNLSEECVKALALSTLAGLSQTQTAELLREYGSACAVFERRGEVGDLALREALALWDAPLGRAREMLERCEESGVRVVPFASEDYPAALRSLADAPAVLFQRGAANLNALHVLAIVGTRHVTEHGRQLCERFVAELAALVPDVVVVSGLAYGVDITAHRAALASGLPTVGVVAHGLHTMYPAAHRTVARQMLTNGAVVSEYPLGRAPYAPMFLRRNRIIAGLAEATLVVESAYRGGALTTARIGRELGRRTFAFPGRVSDEYSAGCNALISSGRAELLTSAAQLVEALGWKAIPKVTAPVQRQLFPELSEVQQRIVKVGRSADGMPLNRAAQHTGLTVQALTAELFELEMMGVVRQKGNVYFVID